MYGWGAGRHGRWGDCQKMQKKTEAQSRDEYQMQAWAQLKEVRMLWVGCCAKRSADLADLPDNTAEGRDCVCCWLGIPGSKLGGLRRNCRILQACNSHLQGAQVGGSLLYDAGNRSMPSMADTQAIVVGRTSRFPRKTFTAAWVVNPGREVRGWSPASGAGPLSGQAWRCAGVTSPHGEAAQSKHRSERNGGAAHLPRPRQHCTSCSARRRLRAAQAGGRPGGL